LRRAMRGRLRFDLSGTHAFAVHGFAGTVTSTVVLHLAKARRQSAAGFSPPTKVRRIRSVTQRLSLFRVAGQLTPAVPGSTNPLIGGLADSCGLTGTLRLAPRVGPSTAFLTATGPASRPYQDFLAALGLSGTGRSNGIRANALVVWPTPGQIQATLSQA